MGRTILQSYAKFLKTGAQASRLQRRGFCGVKPREF